MELWIRSQNKDELVKVENIKLIYDTLCSDEVQLIHINSDKTRLGSYVTEKRALEVLDEIQACMTINETITGDYENQDLKIKSLLVAIQVRIYEMPKE